MGGLSQTRVAPSPNGSPGTVDLAIVGGGPAGLAAALAALECGVRPTVIDENVELGGQYFRQRAGRSAEGEGRDLIARVRAAADVRLRTMVWGIFDGRTLALARDDAAPGVERVEARALILATGAYDRPVPFPGWTLPGVMTAGGAQNLMKGAGVLPGRRVLIAGSGPLLLVVAHYLLAGGAEVVALCEAASMRGLWRYGLRMLPHLGYVRQAMGYWRELSRARVPVLNGHVITRALGKDALTAAVVSACDDDWTPRPGTERRFDVDAVVVGYGFVPSTDLARLAGCDIRYVHDVGGHVPVLDGDLQTTVPGVFVAGEAGGVAGSAVALDEGRLAGLAAAHHLGRIDSARFQTLAAPVRARLARLAGFRAVMDELYRLRPGLSALMDADTIVCRCEELRAGEIRGAIDEGAHLVNEVKIFTRAGMGRCQGRMCGPTIAAMIGRVTGATPEALGTFTARTPVKPVSLAALAAGAEDHT